MKGCTCCDWCDVLSEITISICFINPVPAEKFQQFLVLELAETEVWYWSCKRVFSITPKSSFKISISNVTDLYRRTFTSF
ncbi:unnamed protein product [Rhizophagus irregularis]|nr:unnamed protein product [Rhizophagus irregularis]